MLNNILRMMIGGAAAMTVVADELPERILSGYGGSFLGTLEDGHIFRMIDKMGESGFNSIDVKMLQPLSKSVPRMQVEAYKSDVVRIYERAKEKGLILQLYVYPGTARRMPDWPDHARCRPVVDVEGQPLTETFAINEVEAWRTMFEHAYSFARLHKEVPFASLKFDIEITPLLYSYDDATWSRFCKAHPDFPADTPAEKRALFLEERQAKELYQSFFDSEVEAAVRSFAEELHAIAPDLILGVMPAQHKLARIMARVLATESVPAIIEGWELYNGGGWDPEIAEHAREIKQLNPNNRYLSWLRPDTYSEEDLAVNAYYAAANLDGYSFWSIGMMDCQRNQVPEGMDPDGCFRAFARANAAIRSDIKERTLTNPSRIPFKKTDIKVASLKYDDLVIPTLKVVGSGSMEGSVDQYLLRDQQVILFRARQGESLDITLAHLGGKSRPTALQYALMDQQKNILRNESITFDTSSQFTVAAPHTGTYALVLSAGEGGQSWYSVKTATPFAAVYQPGDKKEMYFFNPQKLFLPGGSFGNHSIFFRTSSTESWSISVDGGEPRILKRTERTEIPLPEKPVSNVVFDSAPFDWSQNIHLRFPEGGTPLVFFGPHRTMTIDAETKAND